MYRKCTSIHKAAFRDDIALSTLASMSTATEVAELVDEYNTVLSELVEKHASLRSSRAAIRPLVPWFSERLADAKRTRRQLERRWRRTSLHVHRGIYKTQSAHVKKLINTAKSDYFASELEQCGGNSKRLQRRKSACLPQNDDTQELATRFANFFSAKIEMIRATVGNNSAVTPSLGEDKQQKPSASLLHTFAIASISANSSPSRQQHLARSSHCRHGY